MIKKFKKQLKTAFAAPEPQRKQAFLASVNFPKVSHFDFVIGQIGYIRKRVWIVSSLLLAITLSALHVYTGEKTLDIIWMVSSMLPMVALVSITEITRSAAYHMTELEMSCKHNFGYIMLVRLGVLGGFHLLTFGLFMVSLIGKTDFFLLRLGMYVCTPFLLTCILSFIILTRLRSKETLYICGGISCFVSVISLFTQQYPVVFLEEYLPLWIIVFFTLLIGLTNEAIRLINKMEELPWNLSSTA